MGEYKTSPQAKRSLEYKRSESSLPTRRLKMLLNLIFLLPCIAAPGLGHPPPNLKKSGEVLLVLAPLQGDDTPLHQIERLVREPRGNRFLGWKRGKGPDYSSNWSDNMLNML